jgi:Holliday junction resolvase RusA-like endonuclease
MDAPLFEMLIPRRPVSHQTKNRENLQAWKDFVYGRARQQWRGMPCTIDGIRLTLVYLCGESPADIDNVIKPIQDALNGVIFADDFQITDIDSHRRFLSEGINIVKLPPVLIAGVVSGEECVYVHISISKDLELYI